MKYLFTCLLACIGFTAMCQMPHPGAVKPAAPIKILRNEIGVYFAAVTNYQSLAPGGGLGYRVALSEEFGVRLSGTYASAQNKNVGFVIVGLQFDYRVEANPNLFLTPSISLNVADVAALGLHYDMMYKPVKFLGLFLEPGVICNTKKQVISPVKAGVRIIF